jgi:cardiolipin synthase
MRRFRRAIGRVAPADVSGSVLKALRMGRQRYPNHRVVAHWRSVVSTLLPLGGVSTGNRLTLFKDGDSNFLSMWDEIDRAKTSVWLQTYTLEPDMVGLKTIDALEKAAERGCEVKLLFDVVGSWKIEERHVERLQSLGATVIFYNPVNFWNISFSFLHRNHRKICLVDEKVAFVGGMNISSHYAGPLAGGNSFFADVNVKVVLSFFYCS